MIDKLADNINEYENEINNLDDKDVAMKENESFTINGNRLNEKAGLINEKIKIASTFTHYIIEICKPNHVNILRKFIEEYEYQIDLLKNDMLDEDEFETLKRVTVAIDLLFGIDISYYRTLLDLSAAGLFQEIYDYFKYNIDNKLSYEELSEIVRRKGYNK